MQLALSWPPVCSYCSVTARQEGASRRANQWKTKQVCERQPVRSGASHMNNNNTAHRNGSKWQLQILPVDFYKTTKADLLCLPEDGGDEAPTQRFAPGSRRCHPENSLHNWLLPPTAGSQSNPAARARPPTGRWEEIDAVDSAAEWTHTSLSGLRFHFRNQTKWMDKNLNWERGGF